MRKRFVAVLLVAVMAFTLMPLSKAEAAVRTGRSAGVSAKVTLTATPESKTVTVGSTVKFSVGATGKGKITYQWQAKSPSGDWKNSSAASAKTKDFTFTAQAGHDAYQFRCIVYDEDGSTVTTTPVKLNVKAAITTQPKAQTVNAGGTAEFTVAANGKAPLSYQWQAKSPSGDWKNSSSPSAKTATLSLTAQAGHNGFLFRCIVTDGNGYKTVSTNAKLTVNSNVSGVTITQQPKAATVAVGSTATFSVKATGNGTLSYQWQAYNPGTKKWSNSSSASAKKATFSITAQTAHNDFKFRCVVTDSKGNTKTSDAVKLTVNPAVSAYTMEAQVIVGGTAQFNVSAIGKAPLTYQWQAKSPTGTWKNSSSASAKTASLKIVAQKAHNGYQFRCVITDSNGNTTTSNPAKLTVLEAQGIAIDASHFPDAAFRTYLKSLAVGKDGFLSDEDIASITEINVNDKGIGSLEGIAYFTALEKLECRKNNLYSLDVQYNKKLTYLDCVDNEISKLDVNSNSKLTYLNCSMNNLDSLKVDQALNLQKIVCTSNNLVTLSVGLNEKLEILKCGNNSLTKIYAEQCIKLKELWIDSSVYDFTAPYHCQVYVDGSPAAG